jgi:hypothetical protein
MIRRELPLTNHASPAEPVAYFLRGFSFVLAPAAAYLVLELNCVVQGCCFSLVRKVFGFVFHAAIGCWKVGSALMAIAQIKPSSSRPIAVMIFLWSLPAMTSFM